VSIRNARIKINPSRIFFFNQANLPVTPPFLQFFFASDGGCGVIIDFKPNRPSIALRRDTVSTSWLWIPGSLALLAPRNDEGPQSGLVIVIDPRRNTLRSTSY
jgi:hypothetical protein